MKPQTWFRFYNEVVDDPKVQRLPAPMFKAWVNFMCIASKHGGVLPEVDDIAYRLRVTRSKAEVLLNELVKAELFEWTDGVAHPHNWNGRQFQSDVSTERVKRWRNAHRNVAATADETPAPDTETEQTDPPLAPRGADESGYPEDFEVFWKAYPRKQGKGDALKSWNKLKPSQRLQEIFLQAIERGKHSPDWLKDNGQFIPKPSTWLNQRRWDDEYSKAKAATAGPRLVY